MYITRSLHELLIVRMSHKVHGGYELRRIDTPKSYSSVRYKTSNEIWYNSWKNDTSLQLFYMNFLSFPWNYEKSVPFAIMRYRSPNFAVNRRIIWISNKICIKGANECSNILNKKKILWKWNTLIFNIFFIQRLKFLKVEIFKKKIYCENVFMERNWTKLKWKWQNSEIFDISDSNHARSELQTYIIIRYLYSLIIKLFTNEVDLLRKLVS
jgi:hypothetical protein